MPRRKEPKRNRRSQGSTTPSNPSQKRKKVFQVEETETIDQCLDRIKAAGYQPIRRMEEPIFQEVTKDGKKTYEPVGKKIVFETKPVETEQ